MRAIVYRLQQYLEYKGYNIPEFAGLLGYSSPQKIYRLFNTEQASPSCQLIEDIADHCKELNMNWLFTGREEMLISTAKDSYKDKYLQCMEEKQQLYDKLVAKDQKK